MADCLLSHGIHLLGVLALSYLVLKQSWRLLKGFRTHILSRWWRTDLRKYGGWAVVTGASDGIGKAYAEELARRGLNVVLISRTLKKLQSIAEGIELQTGRKTKIIQVDFTGGPENYPKIEEGLKDLEIGILVNNVGMVYGEGVPKFLDVPDVNQSLNDIINCNILSAVHMTRLILPQMVARKKGLIINISSEAGYRPLPFLTVYSATKAFVDFFSRGLHAEYKSDGITVQSVLPLMVSTHMLLFKTEANIIIKKAEDFAREALNTVGYTTRTSGCLSHSIQSYVLEHFLQRSVSSFPILVNFGIQFSKLTGKSKKQ
ncbi:very-long-chain 3-oxoacyl-CoA reductase-B-like [Pseudophryne corroboree]|uniref:very-long-chain 3-oxoacyl-CoA reductase-B-like n=1 Tax=Pseudophryne corroboree TaxID=495146 RepID=UPI003082060C